MSDKVIDVIARLSVAAFGVVIIMLGIKWGYDNALDLAANRTFGAAWWLALDVSLVAMGIRFQFASDTKAS